jgi:hypothetical protein
MKNSGQIVVFILILLASGFGLAVVVFSMMGHNSILIGIEINRERALQLAEAGVNRALFELNRNANWTGVGETALGVGSYEVIVTNLGASRLVEARGYIPSKQAPRASRAVRVIMTHSPGADSFRYGVQAGTGGITLNSDSRINGSAFSNGAISCAAGARITGDASAANDISPLTCVQGTAVQGASPQPLPDFDPGYWKSASDLNPSPGCPTAGDIAYSGGSPMLGPCRINGSLTLHNNANLILTGPVYVTGNFSMHSESQLSIDDSFGINGTVLLVEGTISLNSNARVNRVHRTSVLRPDGDFSTAWSVIPAGGPHWSAIDDNVIQPDAAGVSDYVFSNVNGQTNEFNMTTVAGVATTTRITVWAYARNTAEPKGDRLGINIVVDGVVQTQQNLDLAASWGWVSAMFEIATGQGGVDGLRVRLVQDRQGGQDSVEVAAMYAEARYILSGGGHIMLVSASTSTAAIELNSEARGGIFYALNGTVVSNSNSHPVALTGQQIILNSNTNIFYDQGLPEQSFTSGPGGGWVIQRGTWRIIPR